MVTEATDRAGTPNDPEKILATIQRLFPVYHSAATDSWLVTRHDVAVELLSSDVLTKREARITSRERFGLGALARFHEHNLLFADPPAHTRLRRLFLRLYPDLGSQQLRPRVRAIAAQLLDEIERPGQVDLFASFAYPLPVQVICELIGIRDAEATRQLMSWTRGVTRLAEPEIDHAEIARVEELTDEVADALSALIVSDGDVEPNCLLAHIQRAVEATEVSVDEAVSMMLMAFSAGHETTAGLIGGSIRLLGDNPDLQQHLRSHPDEIPSAVEEFLRLLSPIQYAEYSTPVDLPIGRAVVPANSRLTFMFATTNRDPHAFEAPLELGFERAATNLGFGLGRHRCPGSALASIETEEALRVLLQRVRFDSVPGGFQWAPQRFVHRPEQVVCGIADLGSAMPA